jgi:hypothetical protein
MRLLNAKSYSGRLILAVALAIAARPGLANVNLEFRAVPEACASRYLDIGLYAVSDNAGNQPISALDVILVWDPTVLELRGIQGQGQYPYNWLFSGFPDDHQLDGLNNTWSDGNALYEALAQLGRPAYATPEGLLVTQFQFRKLRVGAATTITMPPSYGLYTHTVVYGTVPALPVTGTLTPVTLTPAPKGDLNCSGTVDFNDINPFVQALSDPAGWQATYPGCALTNGDLNCDGHVNFLDINPFVALLSEN